MTQELKIGMLGASGVGKTSLLTAMYKEFAHTLGKTNLLFKPEIETFNRLNNKLTELRDLSEDFNALTGIKSSYEAFNFIFDLGKKGKKPEFILNFQDYPGEWLDSNTEDNNKEFIKQLLSDSHVILIAIDSPALMGKSKWHNQINRPDQITNLFENIYTEIKSPKLIIFVPLRCETYLQDKNSAKNLIDNVKKGYSDLLNFFAPPALSPWITTVITPVQTVGNIVLKSVSEINGEPNFRFSKINYDAEYKPKNAELPLRCILRFMLKREVEDRNFHWGPFSPIRSWLHLDNSLQDTFRHLSSLNIGHEWEYTALQNEKWLTLD